METKRKKILVVDDDKTSLTVAKNALVDDYDVFTVPSGVKLFRLLEKVTPDLILLDVNLPEMSGYDIIRRLKTSECTRGVPVMFLSARMDSESEAEGLRLGAADYVLKPFSKEVLLERMERCLFSEAQKKEPTGRDGAHASSATSERTDFI